MKLIVRNCESVARDSALLIVKNYEAITKDLGDGLVLAPNNDKKNKGAFKLLKDGEFTGVYLDDVLNIDSKGFRAIELNGKIGLLDKNLKVVLEPKYDFIHDPNSKGFRKIALNGKTGSLDKDFNEIWN